MAPHSTGVVSGKISASGVKRQPAGSRWISSCGCDHGPGIRRAIRSGGAGSFIWNILQRSGDAPPGRSRPRTLLLLPDLDHLLGITLLLQHAPVQPPGPAGENYTIGDPKLLTCPWQRLVRP